VLSLATHMASNLRYAFRNFRRSPGLIAAAILATALGIGANTALFGVIQAVLLRPLPYRDPQGSGGSVGEEPCV
jgi:putative ABC transport system permease protein